MSMYPYPKVVGSFMHAIINNQPYFAYVVNSFVQYMSYLSFVHGKIIEFILHYIKCILHVYDIPMMSKRQYKAWFFKCKLGM
jgi:hypothetical protein